MLICAHIVSMQTDKIVALVGLILALVLLGRLFFFVRVRVGLEGFDGGGSEDYDDEYAKIYERVHNDKGYIKHVVEEVSKAASSGEVKREKMDGDGNGSGYKILEAGCGVGADTELIKKLIGKDVISVDRSKSLMKVFKYNLPECQSKIGDLVEKNLFKPSQFDVVLALHNTMYHNPLGNMKQMIKNFAEWLRSGGLLIVNLYNRDKLDPGPREFSQYYTNKKSGRRHALTHFDALVHDASWESGGGGKDGKDGKNDERTYVEKVVFRKSGNSRVVKHKLYFPDEDKMRTILKSSGFDFVKEISLSKIGVEDSIIGVFKKV